MNVDCMGALLGALEIARVGGEGDDVNVGDGIDGEQLEGDFDEGIEQCGARNPISIL